MRAKQNTFTFRVDKSSLKLPKLVDLEVFENLKRRSISVSFNRTKIEG